ncbi:MAG: LptE family protein [Desulfomonile tiedjei]|uniref:LptE family protein n=1 Tax=Desulfomonile tiedjei TaxID=2358 RepID=A0A9D6V5L1_9BACT|nr:LptE family protein [Desulfomonile tiedjei]
MRPALALAMSVVLCLAACGYRFSGPEAGTVFPPDIKTVVLESAENKTAVTGIETELTNDLRSEFALGAGLKPVRSGGDSILKTVVASYEDTPSTYRADGKELTRIGTLKVICSLERVDSKKVLWKRDMYASDTYDVTDTISGTLSNRRRAISRMIKDLIPRIHRSMYDSF